MRLLDLQLPGLELPGLELPVRDVALRVLEPGGPRALLQRRLRLLGYDGQRGGTRPTTTATRYRLWQGQAALTIAAHHAQGAALEPAFYKVVNRDQEGSYETEACEEECDAERRDCHVHTIP